MFHPSPVPRLAAVAAVALGLSLAACSSVTDPGTPTVRGPRFAVAVRVDSAAKGVGLKVNGTLVATQLPANIHFEVSESGRASRVYKISINRNAMAATSNLAPNAMAGDLLDPTTVTINLDEALPSRIFFDTTGPQITGTAIVDRVR